MWTLQRGETMNEDELPGIIDRNESRSHWSAWLIIMGLVIEIVLAIIFRENKSIMENWGPVFATALIALGVYGEIYFSSQSGAAHKVLQSLTETKLATALDRASEAQENLKKYLTARRIAIGPHKSKLAAGLSSFSGTVFDTGFGDGDGEQADFVWDIEEILEQAGWKQVAWGVHAMGVSVIERGMQRPTAGSVSSQNLEIHLDRSSEETLRPAAEALVAALSSVEIVAKIVPINIVNVNTSAMHLLAGPKR